MKQYEYKIVEAYEAYSDFEEMEQYFNSLGEQGWRLAQFDNEDSIYIFMREKRPDIVKGE